MFRAFVHRWVHVEIVVRPQHGFRQFLGSGRRPSSRLLECKIDAVQDELLKQNAVRRIFDVTLETWPLELMGNAKNRRRPGHIPNLPSCSPGSARLLASRSPCSIHRNVFPCQMLSLGFAGSETPSHPFGTPPTSVGLGHPAASTFLKTGSMPVPSNLIATIHALPSLVGHM
jgi:hypothetical protein